MKFGHGKKINLGATTLEVKPTIKKNSPLEMLIANPY